MSRDKSIVAALMFHSVGLENHPWVWSYISEPIETFESKIALLKKRGFSGVFWNELYEHMAGRRKLADNSILLTFDDGYLDNWVYVYPILKKYDMKGTIFVSPDFVDPVEELRPNSDDLTNGQCSLDKLTVAGFLSWSEMREMEASGLVDIQSHASTHTWYFSGPKILGFHKPLKVTPYPWLFWNERPDRKPYYLTEDQQNYLPWGYPILEHKKSLEVTRFFPDEEAITWLTTFVAEHGGALFFRRNDWQSDLEKAVLARFDDPNLPGHYETQDERAERITRELRNAKILIESNLNKRVEFICWPGGANDEFVQAIAKGVGYKSWTLGSNSQIDKRNRPGVDPVSIKRMGTTNEIIVRGKRCGKARPIFHLWRLFEHQGSMLYSMLVKAYRLSALVLALGRSK